MNQLEEPEETLPGQRELEMPDENSDLVQKQLLQLAQHVVSIIQACNKEKES
jgi:hypothetical protein